ncbi:MAG: hypothetical protein ACK6CT_10335 [Planctomycetia bacterium]
MAQSIGAGMALGRPIRRRATVAGSALLKPTLVVTSARLVAVAEATRFAVLDTDDAGFSAIGAAAIFAALAAPAASTPATTPAPPLAPAFGATGRAAVVTPQATLLDFFVTAFDFTALRIAQICHMATAIVVGYAIVAFATVGLRRGGGPRLRMIHAGLQLADGGTPLVRLGSGSHRGRSGDAKFTRQIIPTGSGGRR